MWGRALCNECGVAVGYATPENLTQILTAMELTLDFTTARCSHCGTADLLPGFSRFEAFVWGHCGKDDANAD
jgi:hypothetical protein